ncbi:MAG: hypothetical protein L6Q57_07535 [Alphaproteobacteria bacterium]|nr:hypothetical protein [Alphaproteobacteria bacterium]
MDAILSAGPAANPESDAQSMAALLGKSAQAGIALSQKLDVSEDGDSLRLSLTALAAPLLADHFRRQGTPPSDADINRVIATLQGVVPFAENFMQAKDDPLPDHHPLMLLQVFAPVAATVQNFSFGQPEAKLLSEIAQKLMARAGMMRADLQGTGERDPAAEFVILRALSALYCAAHQTQTKQMMAQGPTQSPEEGLKNVWKNFEMAADMMLALAEHLIPGTQGTSGGGRSGGQKPAPVAQQAQAPVTTQTAPQNTGTNPMSLFAKKPGAAASPPASPETPPQNSAPPSSGSGNPGNPMSFFKKGG